MKNNATATAFDQESYTKYSYGESVPAFQDVNIQLEKMESKTKDIDGATKKLQTTQKQWVDSFKDGISHAIAYGQDLGDVLDGLLRQLAEMVIKSILFGGAGGGGGLLGGLIPGLASGGPAVAGSPYVVGEKGPELFVPESSGKIVPNDQTSGGGNQTVVHMTVQAIDSQGVMDFFSKNKGQVTRAVVENISNDGSIRKAIRKSV